MPSSDDNMIPKVLKVIKYLNPESILDVGCGNGRYGFLFREILDWNWGRLSSNFWAIKIDAVEVEKDYLTSVHSYIYNNVYCDNWLNVTFDQYYDVIFMGDCLEHFEDWKKALDKARGLANVVIVVSPNWKGSIYQGAWNGYKHENHEVVLSPEIVGGRCLYANSKMFMCGFVNIGNNILDSKDII